MIGLRSELLPAGRNHRLDGKLSGLCGDVVRPMRLWGALLRLPGSDQVPRSAAAWGGKGSVSEQKVVSRITTRDGGCPAWLSSGNGPDKSGILVLVVPATQLHLDTNPKVANSKATAAVEPAAAAVDS